MRLVIQRVKSASVSVDNEVVSKINHGIMCLVGISSSDTSEDMEYCCKKLLATKLWENDEGKGWRKNVIHKNFEILCVSQFTLFATVDNKKHIPDFKMSMKTIPAREFYSSFLFKLRSDYNQDSVHDGEFGAIMDVSLVNDGPVTIIIDSPPDKLCVQDVAIGTNRVSYKKPEL